MGIPTVTATAAVAPVGQGFAVTPSDLAYILKQIKIAEVHAANTTSATGPCGALRDQLASPLVSFGLRTVDGSCNNLVAGQEQNGAADQLFPRLTTSVYSDAEPVSPGFGAPGPSSYKQKKGFVFDSQPRTVSNLVSDQTSTNPAAIAAAGFPVRTQGNPGVVPCTTEPDPATGLGALPVECTPAHKTLFIPNVTTDIGLSPPYNSMFTLFGQFFDHGIDQTVKGGGSVFVPLKGDDPLIAGKDHIAGNADDLPVSLRFMALTRGKNQPGPDGVLGDPVAALPDTSLDDVQDAKNTDSPWVDQSQTYSSHPSHQVFLREYVLNSAGRPVATGKLQGGKLPAGAPATQDPGMATWAVTKAEAASKLGLLLTDKDVVDVPMLVVDAYGKFVPGPLRGLPQYMTAGAPVEGNIAAPVAVPANVLHIDTPFLTDIAHSAEPTAAGPDSNLTAGQQLDTTVPAGSFDNELLDAHFIAGDGRVNENIGLTSIHQVFHSEHDRLVDDVKNVLTTDTSPSGVLALAQWKSTLGAAGWNGERLFQAARFITEMEYQHLVFEEFARKVQPGINPFEPFAFTQTDLSPAIRAEFAHAVYRFGHSMLNETIARTNANGSKNDISLLDGFLNPASYTNGGTAGTLSAADAAGSIIMGMSDQVGNELDEFVTDTLRNNLLGLPLDLPAINMARARSEGVPALNVFRRQLFNSTNDAQLTPYSSWVDFGENLKHRQSLVNFVAAYGLHPTIVSATTAVAKRNAARAIVNPLATDVAPLDAAAFMNSTGAWANTGTTSITGLDKIDLWVGGLAEITPPFGGLLGTTFNYVFENQMTDLQNGDRLYYLARTPGMNLRTQLEGNSFAEMMMRNTNVNTLKADSFATADCKFQLGNLAGTPAGFTASGNTVADDLASECDETALLIRQPDGTIQYRAVNTVDPPGINGQAVYNGTPGVDRVRGGNDNDTFWGGLGNDVIEGGAGADIALGGEGSDIITDLAGDDVPKGGPGNDAIDAGPGLDIIMGGEGNDFTNGGANANETFGGAGDDFIMLGESLDVAFGDSGNDWQEGGNQPDLMQGDSGNLFFLDDSQKPGSDIFIGQGGDDDYDMEGGDDIGLGGPGLEKIAGASGYDWEIGLGDPQAQDADLALPIAPLDILQAGVRDKFNEVEALSGGPLNDTLRGDDIVPSAVGGGGFIGCDVLDQAGLDRIAGLDALVPPLATPLATVVAQSASKDCPILSGPVWGDGNILLGGTGNDRIEGRGADDIMDGDRSLNVRISVRNNAGVEVGSASPAGPGQSAMTSQYQHVGGGGTGALVAGSPTLQAAVFAGTVDAGNLVAVREILTPAVTAGDCTATSPVNCDTAIFSGLRAGYTVATVAGVTTVTDNVGTDGTDTLRNFESLEFADTATPVAPTAVTATGGVGRATVSWVAPQLNGVDQVVTGYSVQVSLNGAVVGALRPAAGNVTTLDVTGLAAGSYTFRVLATNAAATPTNGPLSLPSTATTVTAAAVPGAPIIGTATAGVAGAVTVRWAPPAVTGSGPITGFDVQAYNAAGTVLVGGVRPAAAGTTSLVVPGLPNGSYSFRVLAKNATGSGALSGLSNAVAADATLPTVIARTPAIGARSVNLLDNMSVTFSEPMAAVTGSNFALRLTGTAVIPAAVTYNATTRVATLNPSATLLPDRLYTVTAASARDLAGNTMPAAVWSFTTGPAPTIGTITPAPNATGVARNSNVTAQFSELVTALTASTVQLTQVTGGAVVPSLLTWNATTRVLTINPSASLVASAAYRVTITGGNTAVRDLAGNPLVTRSWVFSTGTAL